METELQEQGDHQSEHFKTNLTELSTQSKTLDDKLRQWSGKLKGQLETKLKEQSERLETKLKGQSEQLSRQSEQFEAKLQEAVRPLSECHKVMHMLILVGEILRFQSDGLTYIVQ